jgi:DNA (cytosine-5)-methyltransferase 1
VRLEPHPLACATDDELLALAATFDRPLAADLFCGAGGLSRGLSDAGFEVVLSVDHDADALETHRAHHPGLSVDWDLGSTDTVERVGHMVRAANISLVAGGPPCQPFSKAGRSLIRSLVRAGRRNAHDERRDMWESFLDIVDIGRPAAVLMENVPDIALDRAMVILRAMIERLEGMGYSVDVRILEARKFGVPQIRQRMILVALANGLEFTWPEPAGELVSVRAAIGDLPDVEPGWRPDNGGGVDPVASGWIAYAGPKTGFQRRMRNGVAREDEHRIFDHITRPVRDDDLRAFEMMSPDTKYSDLPADLKRYRDDIFVDKYKRLDPDNVSRTITAHLARDGYWYIHPEQNRTITVREAARLQTFPDDFRFAGGPSSAFRQIGNAVPVELGRHLGAALISSSNAAGRSRTTTDLVSTELADWFSRRDELALPWLRATSRWQVIQAELFYGRAPRRERRDAWAALERMPGPSDTIAALPALQMLDRSWGGTNRSERLEKTARWFVEHPEALSPDATVKDLLEAPNVTSGIADLACRVVPGANEDPVVTVGGILRVAARFTGRPVDNHNRQTDGRLVIASMIGGKDSSHDAHLALLELAAGPCRTRDPNCDLCPLQSWCHQAAGAKSQGQGRLGL